MSIRIIPQDELGSSEKRTADMIPPLLFPRLKNLYNRRAERLRELAENNPLGDYLRFAALIAHARDFIQCGAAHLFAAQLAFDRGEEGIKFGFFQKPAHRASPRWIFTFCRVISTGKSC